MYCTQCGIQIDETSNYCSRCGERTARASAETYYPPRRLYRSRSDRKLGGVCAGLAEYFNADPSLMRLLIATMTIVTGGILALAYIVAWIIIPDEPFVARLEHSPTVSTT